VEHHFIHGAATIIVETTIENEKEIRTTLSCPGRVVSDPKLL
jgi:hypothetical protein